MTYQPLYIRGNETGLVQERIEHILPDDAYPILENAFLWRERIKRKQGCKLLGRLRRVMTLLPSTSDFAAGGAGTATVNVYTVYAFSSVGEPNREIQPGSVVIVIGGAINQTLTDNGDGTFSIAPAGVITNATINYNNGDVALTFNAAVAASASTFTGNYFPGLPVMGLRSEERNAINSEQLVAFDQIYAYIFGATGFQEFIPGTTWSGNDSDFFWSTNYWVDALNNKLFWVTNFSATDPIRYTNGTVWTNFAPILTSTVAGNTLDKCLCILPFRGRLVVFNTFEGGLASIQYPQRIRWAAIGSPIVANAWFDDIRGKGGFLDIPTSENIVSVGFVRDNLVIYCERSTWQLRYTGRSIAPFQIEKVNTELGAESTFSAVQFDTSLVGIGDKGIVECDSYKSERIDIKIPDLVFQFNNDANGPSRVHGIRDIQQRLAYWTYPYKPDEQPTDFFPNRRLVYNYENDSWAIFVDSFTCFGTYQPQSGARWLDYVRPEIDSWQNQNAPWVNRPSLFPSIIAGNQQGFVEYIGNNLSGQVKNDITLSITNITGNVTTATRITSPNHNLETNQVIQIILIPAGTPFATSLNTNIFGIVRIDKDNFDLYVYDPLTDTFFTPQLDPTGIYVGGGKIAVLDNFRVVSKRFNFLDQGQTIQLGYIDILMNTTSLGGITLKVYLDYNNNDPSNIVPENEDPVTLLPDTFFNSVVPTSSNGGIDSLKEWHRVFCATRASFITIEWTLSNLQMIGPEQNSDVQIDSQILWMRPAGRQLVQGF